MLSGLSAEPQIVIDDAEFWDFNPLPLFGRIGTGDARTPRDGEDSGVSHAIDRAVRISKWLVQFDSSGAI
jgi:hypothetical protein